MFAPELILSFKVSFINIVFVTNNKEPVIIEGESSTKTKKVKFAYSDLFLPFNQVVDINLINDPDDIIINS